MRTVRFSAFRRYNWRSAKPHGVINRNRISRYAIAFFGGGEYA
jgi:hypothetical protein